MDNPQGTQDSNAPLNQNTAAEAFAALLEPQAVEPEKEETPAAEVEEEVKAEAEAETTEEAQEEDDPTVTVKIDGKEVEVKLSELKNGYQRQADYTRKTMEVSETRKAAEAEMQKAQQERTAYAQNLQKMAAQLEGALQEQNQIDWNALIQNDPVEYLKQQHLLQQRQAAYQQNLMEQQKISAQFQAEQQKAYENHLLAQRDELLAKLPEWKDEAKQKAEKAAMREYLINQGYDDAAINAVADARAVVMARKAMLYDQMMAKAQTAAKKVSELPKKIERPGVGASPALDKRSSAFQKLSKTGSVEDAAAVFANFV